MLKNLAKVSKLCFRLCILSGVVLLFVLLVTQLLVRLRAASLFLPWSYPIVIAAGTLFFIFLFTGQMLMLANLYKEQKQRK